MIYYSFSIIRTFLKLSNCANPTSIPATSGARKRPPPRQCAQSMADIARAAIGPFINIQPPSPIRSVGERKGPPTISKRNIIHEEEIRKARLRIPQLARKLRGRRYWRYSNKTLLKQAHKSAVLVNTRMGPNAWGYKMVSSKPVRNMTQHPRHQPSMAPASNIQVPMKTHKRKINNTVLTPSGESAPPCIPIPGDAGGLKI